MRASDTCQRSWWRASERIIHCSFILATSLLAADGQVYYPLKTALLDPNKSGKTAQGSTITVTVTVSLFKQGKQASQPQDIHA
jgi:hypothetical protein